MKLFAKRAILCALSFSLVAALAGCGGNEQNASTRVDDTNSHAPNSPSSSVASSVSSSVSSSNPTSASVASSVVSSSAPSTGNSNNSSSSVNNSVSNSSTSNNNSSSTNSPSTSSSSASSSGSNSSNATNTTTSPSDSNSTDTASSSASSPVSSIPVSKPSSSQPETASPSGSASSSIASSIKPSDPAETPASSPASSSSSTSSTPAESSSTDTDPDKTPYTKNPTYTFRSSSHRYWRSSDASPYDVIFTVEFLLQNTTKEPLSLVNVSSVPTINSLNSKQLLRIFDTSPSRQFSANVSNIMGSVDNPPCYLLMVDSTQTAKLVSDQTQVVNPGESITIYLVIRYTPNHVPTDAIDEDSEIMWTLLDIYEYSNKYPIAVLKNPNVPVDAVS